VGQFVGVAVEVDGVAGPAVDDRGPYRHSRRDGCPGIEVERRFVPPVGAEEKPHPDARCDDALHDAGDELRRVNLLGFEVCFVNIYPHLRGENFVEVYLLRLDVEKGRRRIDDGLDVAAGEEAYHLDLNQQAVEGVRSPVSGYAEVLPVAV